MTGAETSFPDSDRSEGADKAQQLRLLEQLYAYQAELEAQNRELRASQEALETARNRYQDLYDEAPVGYATLRRHGIIEEANATLARMLGYRPGELRDRPFSAWLGPGESGAFFTHLRQAIQAEGVQTTELTLRTASGAAMDVHLQTQQSSDEGEMGKLLCVITDITEEKRLARLAREREQQLAHLSRVAILGEIAATLAHEVNQPLSAIGTYAETARRYLDREPPDVPQAQSLLGRAIEQVSYAGNMVRTVRDFSRPGSTALEWIDLNRVVSETEKLLSKMADEHRVVVYCDLAEGLPEIQGNPTQFQQVAVNLVLNAIEAHPEDGGGERTVVLRTWETGEAVVFEVADRGVGVGPETTARMFDAFYTTKASGLGMGLAICKTIVEAHGGQIWVTPQGGDQGTAVGVSIPIGEALKTEDYDDLR